ncbi:reverse transcriptase domain-containing protein [Tanacetum coccineum]
MDDEPMWAVDRVVAPTLGSAITIPETLNEFSVEEMLKNCHGHNLTKGNIIKIFYHGLNETTQEVLNATAGGIFLYKTPNQAYQLLEDKVLLKLDWAKNQKPKSSPKKTVAFVDECSSNSNTDKIMAQMDAITMKMDAWLDDKQSARPSRSLLSNTQPNLKDDEDEESTPQPKSQTPKPVKETPTTKPYKLKIPYPQCLQKEKMEAQYGKFLDMIQAVQINVSLVDVLAGMPNYGKYLKELVSNSHKLEQTSSAFLSNESSAMIENKVPPKLKDPESFLIPCTFRKTLSCNALADLGASINLMPYSLYAKLFLKTLKPTKISAITVEENSESDSDKEEIPFEKITFDIDYKIKTSLKERPTDLELKQLPDHLEYSFLEEPSFLPVIISSQLSKQNKGKLVSILKRYKQAFAWKIIDIPGIYPSFYKHKIQLLENKKPVVQKQRRLNPNMQEVV